MLHFRFQDAVKDIGVGVNFLRQRLPSILAQQLQDRGDLPLLQSNQLAGGQPQACTGKPGSDPALAAPEEARTLASGTHSNPASASLRTAASSASDASTVPTQPRRQSSAASGPRAWIFPHPVRVDGRHAVIIAIVMRVHRVRF